MIATSDQGESDLVTRASGMVAYVCTANSGGPGRLMLEDSL